MRNKLMYSYSIKIHASGFEQLLESIFCILLVVKAFSLQEDIEMLKEVMIGEEVRWIWQMSRTLQPNFFNFWNIGSAMCSWVLLWSRIGLFLLTNAGCICFTSECIPLICWAYFSDVLVLLHSESCSGSDGQQTTKQWLWLFWGASLALGSALELLLGPTTELVITGCI